MTCSGELEYRHAPLVWRSTLRGVLVLDDELRLLEGLGATIWVALVDGPVDREGLASRLTAWSVEVVPEALDVALDGLRTEGLLVT